MGIQINGNNDIISALDGSWTAEGASINTSGILTATTFKGNIVGTAATFTGPVTIGGTLTYEDVTNIDSVGVVTARSGLKVTGGQLDVGSNIKLGNAGVVTATTFVGNVTGTASNASGATGDFSIADKIVHTGDTDTVIRFPAANNICFETTGSEALRIDSNQRVMIGSTASGGWKFRVQVPANASYQAAANITNNTNADLQFEIKNSESRFGPSTNTPLVFKTGNAEKVRITSAGKVGIGTDNPAGNLEIDAASTTDMIMLDVAGTNFAKIGHNSASGVAVLDVRSEGHIRCLTGGNNERLRITSDGAFGFGDTAPVAFTNYTNLSIHGPSGGAITFGDDGTDEWEIYGGDGSLRVYDRTNTTERLRITSTGKVGINEDVPQSTLHVASTSNYVDIGLSNSTSGHTGSDGANIFLNNNLELALWNRESTGVIRFATAGTERLRIDSSGKIGVGISPNAWQSSTTSKLIQIGNSSIWDYDLQQCDLGQNFYYDGSNYKYIANGYATKLAQLKSSGDFIFYQSSISGTGGNTLTWYEKLRLNWGTSGHNGTVDVKGIPATLRLFSQRDTSDWDAEDPIGNIDFYVGDDTTNNLPYNTNFIRSINSHLDNQGEPGGHLIFGSCYNNQSGGAVETMRLSHDPSATDKAHLQTQGIGAIRDVYDMMNIKPDGTTFDYVSNNSDGGGTSWEIQDSRTIRLYNTSGGHGGNWGREVLIRQDGWYYWRTCVRVTTTCTSIHPSTPTSRYKYPIGFRFYMGGSGAAASCTIQLWREFATTGTCNGNQVGTGSLSDGTKVTKTGIPTYLTAGIYQPTYHTNGYQGVRELNIHSLELVQCGAKTHGYENNGTY